MKLATLEQPEEFLSQGTIVASAGPDDLSQEKQKLLWDLVEKNGVQLLDCQKDKFYNLLINYSCIFATSDLDLEKVAAWPTPTSTKAVQQFWDSLIITDSL